MHQHERHAGPRVLAKSNFSAVRDDGAVDGALGRTRRWWVPVATDTVASRYVVVVAPARPASAGDLTTIP